MFEDVTEWHIEHEYYKQMSTKSEVVSTLCNLHKNHIMWSLLHVLQVPLGVLNKNENKGDDMVDIMSHIQQYVPAVQYTKSIFLPETSEAVEVRHARYHKILFGGDQLTVARARGA